jgi:protein TonB
MAVALYRPARATSRFPRWGYLDKFEVNPVMPRAFVLSVAIMAVGVGIWQGTLAIQRAVKGRKVVAHGPVKKRVAILTAADIGVPPSLTQQQASAVKVEVKTRPAVAMPKPVADELAVEETIATQEEISSMGSGAQQGNTFGAGDSLVVDAGAGGLPSPDEYVAFEKEPELVSMKEPAYPDIAREAGVEGTVMIRVLVGEDGFVKDMMIVQSVQMLDDAAVNAAQTAVFKPALQKDKPVAVWMVIPIEFSLRN